MCKGEREVCNQKEKRLIVHLSSGTHGFCVANAPVQHRNAARAILGYCDHGMRACPWVSVAYDGIRTGHFGSRTDCLLDQQTFAPYSDMSPYTREWSSVLLVQQGLGSSREPTHEEHLIRMDEAIGVEARKAWQRTCDLKRKASEALDNVFSHRERTRRISNEHAWAEALVNDGLGTLEQAVRAAPQATHSRAGQRKQRNKVPARGH